VLNEENAEIVDLLFSATNDLVDELATESTRARALASQLPQNVRDDIAQRALIAARRNRST